MVKFYGESLIKPVAPKTTAKLTAAEKKAAREAKAEAIKQAKRQARIDAEVAATEQLDSAEKDDKLMSLEDLADEDLTPVPLRQIPAESDQTINPLVTNPAYAIREFVNSDKSHKVQYTLSLEEFHEIKLAGVIAKNRRYFVHLAKSIYRNSHGTQPTPPMVKRANKWRKCYHGYFQRDPSTNPSNH